MVITRKCLQLVMLMWLVDASVARVLLKIKAAPTKPFALGSGKNTAPATFGSEPESQESGLSDDGGYEDGGFGGGGGGGGGDFGGGGGGEHGKYFMYLNNPTKDHYEFGYKRGNEHHFTSRHEKAAPHAGHFKTKVHWGDKHGGHGEHYWDYNHGGHHDEGDGGDGEGGVGSDPVPEVEPASELTPEEVLPSFELPRPEPARPYVDTPPRNHRPPTSASSGDQALKPTRPSPTYVDQPVRTTRPPKPAYPDENSSLVYLFDQGTVLDTSSNKMYVLKEIR